ncbi:MAG TPA: serine hydrolase domain-containing protein [Acetobacteraceae bacterium]|nr:serine hydrolase domain-containing protein [Acetobacteraceae bacterium]
MAGNEIDQPLRAAVADGRVPGVVALAADRNGTFYQSAFGRRSLAEDTPMTLDTVFRIASMTKAVTGVAAMQCVERGLLSLDQPAGEIMPALAEPRVLDGFDAGGQPILRPARRKITLRMLLTHTAGFVYPVWNASFNRYLETTGTPIIQSGKLAALNAPLGFQPGERWEYGINIDWAGRMVETVSGQDLDTYMRANIFVPLGMHDTGFVPTAEQYSRSVPTHARKPDGSLEPVPRTPPARPEFFGGGGGLSSTGPDYLAFLRMLLNGGSLKGAQVLQPDTVAMMLQNHIGDLLVTRMASSQPAMSNDVELFPGMAKKWGLTWLINTEDVPGRRSAGSVAWAGLFNTYYWLDPKQQVAGVILTQILPFADPTVLHLLDEFETAVYRTVKENARNA